MNDFIQNKKLGLCSGVIANKKNNSWKVENRYNNDHARGAIKLYSHKCFNKIGGLNETMGWDTLDEMKILYNKFEIKIYNKIIVKQMRNTASRYKKNQYKKQGRVMYLLRYNLILLLIGSIKLAITSKSIISFCHCIIGYVNSWINKEKYIVIYNDEVKGLFSQNCSIYEYNSENVEKTLLILNMLIKNLFIIIYACFMYALNNYLVYKSIMNIKHQLVQINYKHSLAHTKMLLHRNTNTDIWRSNCLTICK